MKNLIQKVCSHGKKITVKLKRHHKKFLFWALCCWFLALIWMTFFSKSKADSILDYLDNTWYAINWVSHTYDWQYINLTWNSYSNVNIDIFLWDESRVSFVALGSVNSEQRSFTFEKRYNWDHIIKLRPSDWSQEINYTAHLTNTENLWLATWMSITLNPWWNVFSTPALLSNISFSNEWNGISFSKLESGQWISVMPSTSTITPLEGFLAKNSNNSAVTMYLTYRDTTPSEDMLSKNVSRWRNLLWITTTDDPFYNIHPGLHLDFTKNAITNLLNIITTNYISKNGSIEYPEIWEAYWVFLSSDRIYWWSNSRYLNNGRLYQNDNDNYSEIIRVTPWSYNIPLLKWRVTAARDLSFRNTGFYLEISWANAYEDVAWYEAGWIIYDIIVNVWEWCTSHIDKSLYTQQTDARWYKKIYIPFFNTCNTIPAWDHKISVLIWINSEYARNFKTGMTITMNSLNRLNFNESIINWEIKSSVIEVSHNNLPSLSIIHPNDDIEVNVTTTWTQNFTLWSIQIHGNEPWESVSVLFDTDRSNDYDPFMYVDTYVNWDLINSRLYDNNMMKYLIPLAENTGTKISFVWRFDTWLLPDTWSFVPKIIVNNILKDGITYITHNCHYYRWRCTQFNWVNYISHWSLINVDWWSDNIEWCPIEDMYACLTSEDYDSCVYSCSSSSNVHQYSTELVEWYVYAHDNWLTTTNSINKANLYGSVTKMALAKIMVNYAINVLWLEPNESISCQLPSDIPASLNALYDNAYTKLCQLRLVLEPWDFQPNSMWTYADFWTWLSRALNHNDPDALNELNNTSPYYEWHLNWLKGQWIISQNNPAQSIIKWYVFVMLMRADENYTSELSCTQEELVECALAEDTDACLAACTWNNSNEPTYSCTQEELLACVYEDDVEACLAACSE